MRLRSSSSSCRWVKSHDPSLLRDLSWFFWLRKRKKVVIATLHLLFRQLQFLRDDRDERQNQKKSETSDDLRNFLSFPWQPSVCGLLLGPEFLSPCFDLWPILMNFRCANYFTNGHHQYAGRRHGCIWLDSERCDKQSRCRRWHWSLCRHNTNCRNSSCRSQKAQRKA